MRSTEQDIEIPLRHFNLSSEEWGAIRSLADDRSIVIKKIDRGSAVTVSDRDDCVKKAQKQLGDKNVYRKVNYLSK